jgi:MFS transporter, FSR family, fosmidomycin resistance protein
VDTYVGLIPVLYPLLIERFALDFSTVGLVSLAYVGTSSLSQPFFGWVADRYGFRVLRFSLLWTAVVFAAIGFAPSFGVLVVLAAAAGLGSGAYHPFGAVGVRAIAPEQRRGTATSVYVTGGYLGVAAGPLLGVALLWAFGIRGVTLTLLPGLAAALWLLIAFRSLPVEPRPRLAKGSAPRDDRAGAPGQTAVALQVAAVVGVMMSQVWVLYAIQAFVPVWYDSLGYGPSFYGALLTTILLATAFGTVVCGALADRYGKRAVVLVALVLSIPALVAFAHFIGPAAFLTGALVGLLVSSTGSLLLVMAQQLLSNRAGLASGAVLGLGFFTGAIGVPITGMLADAFGLQSVMMAQAGITAATIPLALLLPSETRLADRREA